MKAKQAAGKDGYGPQCDAQGDFVPCQYDQSGEHWCVDTQGKEIDGTRTQADQVKNLCKIFDTSVDIDSSTLSAIGPRRLVLAHYRGGFS